MLVTLGGILTDLSPVHPENAKSAIFVTLGGIVTEVNPVQSPNAPFSMLVTLDGIVTDFILFNPQKALRPMPRTVIPSMVSGSINSLDASIGFMMAETFVFSPPKAIPPSTT